MAKLSAIVIKNEYFREIVSTQKYEFHAVKKVITMKPKKNNYDNEARDDISNQSFEQKIKYKKRFYSWDNTNLLLN